MLKFPVIKLGKKLRELAPTARAEQPDWVQANPSRIEQALARAVARPSGGWYVVAPSRDVQQTPCTYRVCARDLVVWRGLDGLMVAPDACPHMGASLSCGNVQNGLLVCPWHGLKLGPKGHGHWKPLPSYDDGVLLWVRLDDMLDRAETPSVKPIIAPRPERFIDAVIRVDAHCEPADVIANRLDPWHGVHFHPHSFRTLQLIDETPDSLTVRVAYRVAGPLSIEVDARFHSPEPRTIVMTIVAGEGQGSVVETHATPIDDQQTAVIEATLATSERKGFRVARLASDLFRPWMKKSATKLWIEDAAYAERRHAMRMQNKTAQKFGDRV